VAQEDTLVLRGARIVDPSQQLDGHGKIVVQGGQVAAIGDEATVSPILGQLQAEGTTPRIVDLPRGWVLTPGFVDLHAHLREPGYEGKETIESGAQAAARGGFTTL